VEKSGEDIITICAVNQNALDVVKKKHPDARTYRDLRER